MGKDADRGAEGSGVPTNPEAPRRSEAEPSELRLGQVIASRYEVRGRLGAGGMGAVYHVLDHELGEEVALKVLRSDWLGDAVSVERFRREVRLARRIGHANVCRVFDLGEADGLRFLTMERVEGRSLRAVLREGTPTPRQALDMFIQIVDGVAAAHELGIVHRDLKPENVLVRADGRVKVADFGLALGSTGEGSTVLDAGTPQYMAPEQLRGEAVGPASDVFTMGILGHELLTGRSPFGDGPPAVVTSAILRDSPRPLDVSAFPTELAGKLTATLARALEKQPDARFAHAGQLAAELLAIQPSSPSSRFALLSHHSHQLESTAKTPGSPMMRRADASRSRWRLGLVAAGLVAGAAALGVAARMNHQSPAGSPPPVPTRREDGVALSSLEVKIAVLEFEDLAHDRALEGLASTAGETMRSGLRAVPGLTVLDAGEDAAQATWLVRGTVQRVGDAARLTARFQRSRQQIGEPVEVDGATATPATLLDRLREHSMDEARLLIRDHQRRTRATRETESSAARDKLLAYYDLIGYASRPEDLGLGLTLVAEALAHDPHYASAKLARAELLAQRAGAEGKREYLDAALADVGAVLAEGPGDPYALTQRCRYRRFMISFESTTSDATLDAATEACEAALRADPSSAAVLHTLAKLHARRCEDEQAIQLLERALELDRSRAGEILPHLTTLAVESSRLSVADRMTAQLVTFQQDEERLGRRALGRRAGMDPAQGAYLLRGGVLLRLGRVEQARAAFEEELRHLRHGYGAEESEAAAIVGLQRVAALDRQTVPPDLAKRLREIEAKPRSAESIEPMIGELSKVAPDAALSWVDKLHTPTSCNEAIQRASVYINMSDGAAARRALAVCTPVSRWERACVEALSKQAAR
jgi:serine/threonine protein kinase/tetratricopeptide (TPR) repeat protein